MPEPKSKVPSYYVGRSGTPAWDAIEDFDLNYNLGCAWKYIARAGKKTSDPRQDLAKAIHCLEREIECWPTRPGSDTRPQPTPTPG